MLQNFYLKGLIVVLLLVNLQVANAQTEEKKEVVPTPAPTAAAKKPDQCECETPAITSLSKTAASLNEDDWNESINICMTTIIEIEKLKTTCKCPIIDSYKKIADAYLKYAQGGQILDGEADIDCIKAKKLYDDAIKALNELLPVIQNEKLKEEVSEIKDYCIEEKSFVEDECEE